MKVRGSVLVALIFAFVCQKSHAFPEMVRHGYVNCTSCHISPNGGGIINAYGRVQSEEILSTWSREGEGGVLHGLIPPMDPLSLGGQFRLLQLFREDVNSAEGRTIFMQGDAEAALHVGRFDAVATLGVQDAPYPVFSRRHYLIFRPNDDSPWMVRVGRFLPAFGINVPDHIIATKAGLGFGQGTESYNLEVSWLAEQFDFFVTGIFGRPGKAMEQGFAVRTAYNFNDTSKLGLSYYFGTLSGVSRHVIGPYSIIGFNRRLFLLAELFFQARAATPATFGPAGYGRLDWEFIQGIHLYLTGEYSLLDASQPSSHSYGLGMQFFPRPHFELRAEFDQRMDMFTGGTLSDYVWLMGHYYL